MFLPKPVLADIMRGSRDSLVEWIFSDVPKGWEEWPVENRRRWRREAELRKTFSELGLTRKRDRICVIEIWCEFYGYEREKISQSNARSINKMLEGIPGLRRADAHMRFGIYGFQRGFYIE